MGQRPPPPCRTPRLPRGRRSQRRSGSSVSGSPLVPSRLLRLAHPHVGTDRNGQQHERKPEEHGRDEEWKEGEALTASVARDHHGEREPQQHCSREDESSAPACGQREEHHSPPFSFRRRASVLSKYL